MPRFSKPPPSAVPLPSSLTTDEHQALKSMLAQVVSDDDSQQLKDAKLRVAALRDKLQMYMIKNGFLCVRVPLADGDKFLRLRDRTTPRKLTVEALVQALEAITADQVHERTAALQKRKADASLPAVLVSLVFDHVRNNHYRPCQILLLEDKCPHTLTPHDAGENTLKVVREWLRCKDVVNQLKETLTPQPSQLAQAKMVLSNLFQRTQTDGDVRVFMEGGRRYHVVRKYRTRSYAPRIAAVQKRFQQSLQSCRSLDDVIQRRLQLAEDLLYWIDEEQSKTRTQVEDVLVVPEA